MALISLDTNILVYAVDPTAEEKMVTARALLRSAALAEAPLAQQVIGEFLNVSRRMHHLNQRRLRRIAVGLCATFQVLPTPLAMLFEAFDLAQRAHLQFWDAVIIRVCRSAGVDLLLSEDLQDGQNIDGVTIVNPFAPGNVSLLSERLGTAP
jgi:predicted nucleic acid-binding protein